MARLATLVIRTDRVSEKGFLARNWPYLIAAAMVLYVIILAIRVRADIVATSLLLGSP